MAKTGEERVLLSKALDAARFADARQQMQTTQFLNEHECTLVQKAAQQSNVAFCAFGGYPEAGRKIVAFHPDYLMPEPQDFPICMLTFQGKEIAQLNHRDYLGALLNLGITREKIGDIIPNEDCAYAFCMDDMGGFVAGQIKKIGNKGVKVLVSKNFDIDIPPQKFKEIRTTVSSLRLDSVVSAGAGIARSEAAQLIEQGKVMLQWEQRENPAAKVEAGEVLSVRGVGRMKVEQVTGPTKKGRLGILIHRYL